MLNDHLHVRYTLPLVAVTLHTAYRLGAYVVAMHTVRFVAECAYARLCAPTPSWAGYVYSFVMANSDMCVALRKTSGFVHDAMALAVVGGVHALIQTIYGGSSSLSKLN